MVARSEINVIKEKTQGKVEVKPNGNEDMGGSE